MVEINAVLDHIANGDLSSWLLELAEDEMQNDTVHVNDMRKALYHGAQQAKHYYERAPLYIQEIIDENDGPQAYDNIITAYWLHNHIAVNNMEVQPSSEERRRLKYRIARPERLERYCV